MGAFSFWDILIVAFVVLLIFGPKRLPQMGRSIGGGIREFKDSVTNRMDKQDAEAEGETAPQVSAQPAPAQLPPAPPPAAQPQPQPDPRERDTVL